jgi:predicted dehydrogenase
MTEQENEYSGYNRRDFLKGGSVATLMTMLGGVELLAQTNEPPTTTEDVVKKNTVAVIGLGNWGREIVNSLHLVKAAELAGLCDSYEPGLNRVAKDYSAIFKTKNYQEILSKPEIKAVVVATPTHLHKEIVIAALGAGKHVYCEMPLAHTIEDARAIAEAAKAKPHVVFQAGLQLRADDGRHYALKFLRTGAIGQALMARAQWHTKHSWRFPAATAEREKALNWRLDKNLSLGLIGEIGCQQIDQTSWFLKALPVAITGFGKVLFHTQDGREVPDTIQAVVEYPGGVRLTYDATLASSFDAAYEIYYGSDAALMVRDDREWLFQEVDCPQMGWEVYARKENFYKASGIVLAANASKLVVKPKEGEKAPPLPTPLRFALDHFLRNTVDLEDHLALDPEILKQDASAIREYVLGARKRPAAGFAEGLQATLVAIKANEAVVAGKRVEMKPELYELA